MDGGGIAHTHGEFQRPWPAAALWCFNEARDGGQRTRQRVVGAARMRVDFQIEESTDIANQLAGQDVVFLIEQGLVATPQPLGAVQEGDAAPSDLGLDWMLAAPSVCVTNGCVTELVGTLLGAAEGPEDRTKALHTLHYVACVQGTSAADGGGRGEHAGSQEMVLSGCHVSVDRAIHSRGLIRHGVIQPSSRVGDMTTS